MTRNINIPIQYVWFETQKAAHPAVPSSFHPSPSNTRCVAQAPLPKPSSTGHLIYLLISDCLLSSFLSFLLLCV